MRQENFSLNEKNIIDLIQQPGLYSPLKLSFKRASLSPVDAEIDVTWKGRNARFFAEIKSRTAPKGIQGAALQLKRYLRKKRYGLVVIPFLSDSAVEILNREGLSAI